MVNRRLAGEVAYLFACFLIAGCEHKATTLGSPPSLSKQRDATNGSAALFTSIAWSPDGRRLFVGECQKPYGPGADGRTCEWDAASLTVKRTIAQGPVYDLSLSSDGSCLAIASQTLQVFDLDKGSSITMGEQRYGSPMRDVRFLPGKKLLMAVNVGTQRADLWDVDAKQLLRGPPEVEGVTGLSISPDGSSVGTLGVIAWLDVWSTATWQKRMSAKSTTNIPDGAVFSKDGSQLFSWDLNGYVSWDLATGKPKWELTAESNPHAKGAVFIRSGTRLLLCGDELQMLRASDGGLVDRFKPHEKGVTAMSLSPDGSKLVTAGKAADGRAELKLWDVLEKGWAD